MVINNLPQEAKQLIINLGFNWNSSWLTEDDKHKDVCHLFEESYILFPSTREFKDHIIIGLEIRQGKKDISIPTVYARSSRYRRKTNHFICDAQFLFDCQHHDVPRRKEIIDELLSAVNTKHLKVEIKRQRLLRTL